MKNAFGIMRSKGVSLKRAAKVAVISVAATGAMIGTQVAHALPDAVELQAKVDAAVATATTGITAAELGLLTLAALLMGFMIVYGLFRK